MPYKRAKKDPSAPKRPMSAFLYYSQGRRKDIKDRFPDMKNTEVSRLLGEHWRNASEEERSPFIEKEKVEREKYKIAIADWRTDYEKKKEEQKKMEATQMEQQTQWHMQAYPPPEAGDMPAHHHHHHVQYQQPPPYGMPPPAPYGHHYPPPPPAHYYSPGPPRGYPPYPGPYHYPTNGKQPVILGPTGMPRYPPSAAPPPLSYQPPMHNPHDYDESDEPLPAGQNFDYPDQIPESQAAG